MPMYFQINEKKKHEEDYIQLIGQIPTGFDTTLICLYNKIIQIL